MAEAVEKILLIPRFTALFGNGPFYTAPINVRAYQYADVTAWASKGWGTPTPSSAGMTAQGSQDLDNWFPITAALLSSVQGEEKTTEVEFALDWFRLKVDISGSVDMAASTLWAVGNFVRRAE